ncbi:MAG TPA: hypothetical protein VF669_04895 [Tepidisphaeraceae bacterium]|jgi:uncharacterized membrane protein
MQRLLEILLGLEKGFLSREGELSLQFNPHWPGQEWVGAVSWNILLAVVALALVIYVYRREGRTRPIKIGLGIVRGLLLAFLLVLLNRPVLTLGQSRTEPSVLAVMIDDSISMRVRDAQNVSRLEAVQTLLAPGDRSLLKDLSSKHQVRFYRFDSDKEPITSESLAKLEPAGQHTQILPSLRGVLADLQGQRLAGVVVLTDGRETPSSALNEGLAAVKDFGVKVYPVAVGSDKAPSNIDIQSISLQDSAFKGDIVNVRAMIRGTGYEPGHPVTLVVKDKKTGQMLTAPGQTGETRVTLAGDEPTEAEVQFKADEVGALDLVVEAVKQPGEIDDEDNVRSAQIAVLDAKIALLYVDGYPRWEYRYLKNEMIRDATVDVSCLLTSADPNFAQEGDKPIRRFPESIEELMDYDVVIFGDVDPRQFSDAQLQLVADFVNRRGGGFGMIAGPKWSPQSFKNTPVEALLPVAISRVESDDAPGAISTGFRPLLTKEGSSSSIFRFFAERAQNEKYLAEGLQPIFWYCRNIMAKPGVGEVYATHPSDTGPDGRKAPLLVFGRYGAGRTLFSGIDDSWRWRFYTGESVFDTYWVQQIRYLARSKKLGQRRITFTSLRPGYQLGDQVRVNLRVMDPQLIQQLPEQVRVEIADASGQIVSHQSLVRQEGQPELYVASFTADRVGNFTVKLPSVAGQVDAQELPITVAVPRLELAQPQVDRTFLTRLASETLGKVVDLDQASKLLPTMIQSAARVIPIETARPLWDAPLALAIFVLLITGEWVGRKMFGMV